ncbi:PREDICTED: RING-box protein 2 [Tinamus guttatus]|uniref:RING-box protein 2 n=1 Tax=Tinamus guttatus TaxID=94827 RepID=UPI00052EE21A|nr:PREDICTED: RING-box protein 2 [Tinamus guttatus]
MKEHYHKKSVASLQMVFWASHSSDKLLVRQYSEHQIEFCSCLLLDACLRCQAENKQEDCVVVWGECNHSFHNCCMSLWVKQNNRCPLCQQDWVVQRIGK